MGNIAIWVGFAFLARLIWMAPFILAVLAFAYHAIVRWEEQLLESRLGDPYRAYRAKVPRWIPNLTSTDTPLVADTRNSWRDTLFSERGTLIAIAVGVALLYLKRNL
jgi:hypothetical protein